MINSVPMACFTESSSSQQGERLEVPAAAAAAVGDIAIDTMTGTRDAEVADAMKGKPRLV